MSDPIRVAVCETQPVTIEGLVRILGAKPEFQFAGAVDQLIEAEPLIEETRPNILVLDKSFGVQIVLEWVAEHRASRSATAIVVWGLSLSEAEALRFLQ
ncbi:MAG: hypothetical protein JNK48_05760, partial [Bryobacterales bacterium]|nr:hypothetical protein [Bryobacterales bacterium]